jgi:hypothetical protein
MKCQGKTKQQNPNIIFGGERKFEKIKLFPAVSYLNPLVLTAESNIQLRHVRPATGSQKSLTGEICA